MLVKNRTIKATPNFGRRTFTIRTYDKGTLISKYRTIQLDKEEFESCLNNTQNDWRQFLKSEDYYKV